MRNQMSPVVTITVVVVVIAIAAFLFVKAVIKKPPRVIPGIGIVSEGRPAGDGRGGRGAPTAGGEEGQRSRSDGAASRR